MLIVLLDLYDIFVGINLKQGQGKHLTSKELFAKTAKVSPLYQGEKRTSQTKSKLLSPKETRASELRKQAQLKKTNPLEIKKTVSFFFSGVGWCKEGSFTTHLDRAAGLPTFTQAEAIFDFIHNVA